MSNKPQSFASHAKFDPAFHFFVLPVLLINIFVVGLSSVSPSRHRRRMGAPGFREPCSSLPDGCAVGPPIFRTV